MGTLKVDTIQDSGGNTILSSDGSGGFSNSLPAGKTSSFRNLVINGDMSIAQRGTSFSSQTSGAYYNDRFKTGISGLGTWTISQETDAPTGQGLVKSQKFACTTADASPSAGDFLTYLQPIEGQNLQQIKKGTSSAESLTLSFWVKSNKTGTYISRLYDVDNQRVISQSYTINSASTWEKKTLTFAGDTSGTLDNDNGYSFAVEWCLGAGTTYSSGTLNTSWNSVTNADQFVGQVNLADSTSNVWYITGVQLEVGTTASDFEFVPFDVNLHRCRRYYQKIHDTDGIANQTTEFRTIAGFYPTMRSTPSFSVTGPYEISDLYTLDATQSSAHITTIGTITNTRAFIQMNNYSGLTQGRFMTGPRVVNNDYYIFADAEL